jgi:hypothetical protein
MRFFLELTEQLNKKKGKIYQVQLKKTLFINLI